MKTSILHIDVKKIMVVLVVLSIIVSIISMIYLKINYDKSFSRVDRPNPIYSAYLSYSDVSEHHRTEIEFNSGANILKGHIYGEENNKGLVVLSHGLGFGSENYLAETVFFVENDWRVFTFDNTGTHNSEGNSTVGPSQSLLDLKSALTYINQDENLNSLPLMLYGHSWGAYAVTAILNYDYDINAVVSISGFNSTMELLTEQVRRQLGFIAPLMTPLLWIQQKILFGDYVDVSAVDSINNSTSSVLIIHGDKDESISYQGSSIMNHKSSIVNPNVTYITHSNENQNGHNNLFESTETIEYIKTKNIEYESIYNEYNGKIPDDVRQNYYKTVDRFKTSALDVDFMNRISYFYSSNLGSSASKD